MNGDLFDTSLLITRSIPIVRNVIDEMLIYKHYEPYLELGTQRSPFKLEVKSPSFGLYERHNKVRYKDHSGGIEGDVYDFVVEWYKVKKSQEITLHDVNRIIYYDMKLSDNDTVNPRLFFNDDEHGPFIGGQRTGKFEIQVKDIGWTSWALDYWIERYGISPSILLGYHCGHAKEVWARRAGKQAYLWGVSTPDNPIFYFYFPRSGNMKCYRPLEKNKKKKWLMNCSNHTDIQGYYQMKIKQTLPKLVIFTKAMKEVMFYRSFHLDAIAIHGEDHHFTEDFIRHIRKYSEYQLGVYDNDGAGIHSAWQLRKRHQIPVSFIEGHKNITDLWEKEPNKVIDYIEIIKEIYKI